MPDEISNTVATGGTEVAAIAKAANDLSVLFEQAAAMPEELTVIEDIPAVALRALRNDYREVITDLEQYMPHPRRAKSNVSLHDTSSFVDWFNALKDAESTVWIDQDNARAVGVIDDHLVDPGWRQQLGSIAWKRTPEWTRWKSHDRKYLDQEDFAEHIEESLEQVVVPDATDLLEIAQTVRGSMSTEIVQGRYLNDGSARITWNETVSLTGGRVDAGEIIIPTQIELAIAPFEGGTVMNVAARLRFKVRNKSVEFMYLIDDPKKIERDALAAELRLIQSGVEPNAVYMGNPAI